MKWAPRSFKLVVQHWLFILLEHWGVAACARTAEGVLQFELILRLAHYNYNPIIICALFCASYCIPTYLLRQVWC